MQMHINDKYKKEAYLIDALNQSQLQLEYMSNTIIDFTDFNKQTKEKEHFLASSVVNDVYRITGQTLEAHAISFTITNHNDFSIHSYPNELAQVVLNLVQNAQDVLIEREIKQPAINVIIDKGKICVQDNAGGIEDKIVEQIFEPYFTTKSKSSSLGLGLYMSKIILEKHFNARIEIENIKHCTSFNILFDS
jgi:signal transduction histidine kinase